MGLQQVAISVCNDGNVSQLDCTDVLNGGPYYRIEVYRSSQPSGGYGITLSGSRVEHICGTDHLAKESNRIFRYFFSVGNDKTHKSEIPILLEGREEFNPKGMRDGSWEVRIRDVDPSSDSYGSVIVAKVEPAENNHYQLHYELRSPKDIKRVPIFSPIHNSLTKLNPTLIDLGEPLEKFTQPLNVHGKDLIERKEVSSPIPLTRDHKTVDVDKSIENVIKLIRHQKFNKFVKNLDLYEGFGDFGHKGIHPGTNLIGPNKELASESIFVRQYRAALVLFGRLVSPDMSRGAHEPKSLAETHTNTRPGVYAIFVGAAINKIGIYKLGLDKVHSDYGGIPMKLAPGSRLENGAKPVADAWKCNETLGIIADIFYLKQ
jgi:hypothetical protein